MAGESVTLLERQVVNAGEAGDPVDLGAYESLHVEVLVHDAGSAGAIRLQHAAFLDAFRDLSGFSFNLNSTGNDEEHTSSFLRYVRWATDGSVAGSPVVSLYVIAKE